MGTLLFVCVSVCVCVRKREVYVWKSLLTHAFILPFQINVSVCSDKNTSTWLAYMGHFCGTFFLSCEHVHLHICRKTFAGPVRAFRNRIKLIATMSNDKTVPLPVILIRGKTTLTSQAVPAGFSCSDSDFLSSYSRPNNSGKCLP